MKLYNTSTQTKEEFTPPNKDIGMYVCGLTVYDEAHIGHARTYVAFDVIKRYLRYKGYRVKHIQNITDVDDKMIQRASQENTTIFELAERINQSAMQDFDALNIDRADYYPKATEHIQDIVEFIKKLIDANDAYIAEDGVYFDVRKVKDYGKLSAQNRDQMETGRRIKINSKKHDHLDFALWKKQKQSEPAWDSPWGKGRPGWHIECTVMSMKYLGETVDIHGGARDLIFPHHENEIIQAEAVTKKQFVRYWLHTGFLTTKGEKMSKSLGNIISIKEIFENTTPTILRLFYLQAHYRSPIDFTDNAIDISKKRFERIKSFVERLEQAIVSDIDDSSFFEKAIDTKKSFFEAMDDDFNTPKALAEIDELIRVGNFYLDKYGAVSLNTKKTVSENFRLFFDLFGIKIPYLDQKSKELLNKLLEKRKKLRTQKRYTDSDDIRNNLTKLGIELKDTPDGTVWSM